MSSSATISVPISCRERQLNLSEAYPALSYTQSLLRSTRAGSVKRPSRPSWWKRQASATTELQWTCSEMSLTSLARVS